MDITEYKTKGNPIIYIYLMIFNSILNLIFGKEIKKLINIRNVIIKITILPIKKPL